MAYGMQIPQVPFPYFYPTKIPPNTAALPKPQLNTDASFNTKHLTPLNFSKRDSQDQPQRRRSSSNSLAPSPRPNHSPASAAGRPHSEHLSHAHPGYHHQQSHQTGQLSSEDASDIEHDTTTPVGCDENENVEID